MLQLGFHQSNHRTENTYGQKPRVNGYYFQSALDNVLLSSYQCKIRPEFDEASIKFCFS